jgi:hypothetical protein
MPLLEDIPALQICEACNRLFTDFDTSTGRLIWDEIRQTQKYNYRKLRSEFEHAVILGCALCSKLAFHDVHYRRDDINNIAATEAIRFTEPRPHWYPSPGEEIIIEVEFDTERSTLSFRPCQGVQLIDEQAPVQFSTLYWRLFAPTGKQNDKSRSQTLDIALTKP